MHTHEVKQMKNIGKIADTPPPITANLEQKRGSP